jgi:hypothetical protein
MLDPAWPAPFTRGPYQGIVIDNHVWLEDSTAYENPKLWVDSWVKLASAISKVREAARVCGALAAGDATRIYASVELELQRSPACPLPVTHTTMHLPLQPRPPHCNAISSPSPSRDPNAPNLRTPPPAPW